MTMTVVAPGVTASGVPLRVGDTVVYVSHVPGGNVRIRLPDGTVHIADPRCFDELR